MDFSAKLNFLFDLTGAEGKQLAAAMNITPPQISKMRNGQRGRPHNRDSVRTIARFFAERCVDGTQKEALAQAMQTAQVGFVTDTSVLADMLLAWFWEETRREHPSTANTAAFLNRLVFSAGHGSDNPSDAAKPLRSADGVNFTAFYGVEGRRMATLTLWKHLLKEGKAYEICIVSDENSLWIDDDPSFSSNYYDHMLRLTAQGCFFRRIVGTISNVEQAFHSLNRWFPLYLTGKATSYYYRRLRDNLNRITVFVVSGVAAVFSFSAGAMSTNDSVTFFTTEARTVASMTELFEQYLALCEPAMNTFNADTSEAQMHERLIEYEAYASTCLQSSNALSFITLPWEIAVSLKAGKHPQSKDTFLSSFAKRYRLFTSNLEQYDFYDFVQLARLEDIMDGKVVIPAANIIGDEIQYYTPERYLQHLKSIVYLLKRRRHYHLIIQGVGDSDVPVIYVKDGHAALLTRALSPFIIFNVTERNLIEAFTEYLRRSIPDNILDDSYRSTVISTLQALIDSIEERMAAAD